MSDGKTAKSEKGKKTTNFPGKKILFPLQKSWVVASGAPWEVSTSNFVNPLNSNAIVNSRK